MQSVLAEVKQPDSYRGPPWRRIAGAPVSVRPLTEYSNDGTVYYFGEVVDIYENGEVVDHEGSWLVGGPIQPGDPTDAANAGEPAVFMPTVEINDLASFPHSSHLAQRSVTEISLRARDPAPIPGESR